MPERPFGMGHSARVPTRSDFTASLCAPVMGQWQAATTRRALPQPRLCLVRLLGLDFILQYLWHSSLHLFYPSSDYHHRPASHRLGSFVITPAPGISLTK
jgi:hypothetical protein